MNSLHAATLQAECTSAGLSWRVQVVEEISSTSDVLREAAQAGEPAGLVLFAESQTAGRGRRDNRWLAPKGKDLMFSLLLQPDIPVSLWPRLTTLAALALCRAIETELPLHPQIKWPNDLYLNDRKISGLLAEAVTTPTGMKLVLGIGINVNSTQFPPDLATNATSLLASLPQPVLRDLDRQALAFQILSEIENQFTRMAENFHEVIAEVRARSWLLGRQIRATVDGHEIYGRSVDLDAEGHLILALPDGILTTLSSAEGVRQVL